MSDWPPLKNWLGISFFCTFLLLVTTLNAQDAVQRSRIEQGPVVLTSRIDRVKARVADPVEWTLQLEAPAGSHVRWPSFPEQIDLLEIRAVGGEDDIPLPSEGGGGRRVWTRIFLLETLETGLKSVPAAEVQVDVLDPNGSDGRRTVILRSEPLAVAIESSLPPDADPKQFRDIKDPIDVEPPPPNGRPWFKWAIGGGCAAGLAAIAAGLLWFGRRRRSPVAWARDELSRLRKMPANSSAERQQRFAEVVGVVRQLLAARFHSEIASQTGEEWRGYAEAHQLLDPALRSQTAELLKQHDISRFAAKEVGAEVLEQAFVLAEHIIDSATVADAKPSGDAALANAAPMRSDT